MQVERILTVWELCQEQIEIAKKRISDREKLLGPSELSMSERLKAQLLTQSAEAENLQNHINSLQAEDSQISQLQEMTGRMSELSVLANDGTASTSDRNALQEEFSQIQSSIQQMATESGLSEVFSGIDALSISGPDAAMESLAQLQKTADALASRSSSVGTNLRSDQLALDGLMARQENQMSAQERIGGSDMAWDSISVFASQVRGAVSTAVLAHSFLASKSVLQMVG